MEDQKEINVKELIELKNSTENEKWTYYKKFQQMDEKIKELEYLIYKKCNHEWERDYTYCGHYDKAEHICKFCNLNRNEYRYTKKIKLCN